MSLNCCPNCGGTGIRMSSNGNSLNCGMCGFTWSTNASGTNNAQPVIEILQSDDLELTNISIGKVSKSKEGFLYSNEKKTTQNPNGITTTSIRNFAESAGRVYHSDDQAVGVCKCGNLIFANEFQRSAWNNQALCPQCQHTLEGKIFTRSQYWIKLSAKVLFFIIKIPLRIIKILLAVLFLKEKIS